MNPKKPLGKGLGAIIINSPAPAERIEKEISQVKSDSVCDISLSLIDPNPDQPRMHFDDVEIANLAESISSVGLIQPIILRKADAGRYQIVAGERRFRATKNLGKASIKAIIINADEETNFSIALIENVQRQNLDPIEEAKAYRLLINRFKLKQQDVAKKVGKERATIANSLRLLTLPENIQEAVSAGVISQGHAKVIASLEEEKQIHFYTQILEKNLSVRSLEKLINESSSEKITSSKTPSRKDAHIRQMEEKLRSHFGTKVEIRHSGGKGKIEISYYSLDDFERIVEKIEK
jgi:ParB family chromosome partitioning protein